MHEDATNPPTEPIDMSGYLHQVQQGTAARTGDDAPPRSLAASRSTATGE